MYKIAMVSIGSLFGGLVAGQVGYKAYKYYKTYKQKNNYFEKSLWVETDLEPDDVLAIDILQKNNEIYSYICGEGNVDKKMNRLLNYYGKTPAKLYIKGKGSDKDFPEPYDTTENNESESKSEPKLNVKNEQEYLNELKKFLDLNGKKMVIIKPPRELYELFLSNPDETKKLMANVECYMYGSFNLRSLNTNTEKLKEFLYSFKKLYIFETHYAIGSGNSVNPDNFKAYPSLSNAKYFSEICKQWNDYIIKDCVDTCNSIIKRNDETIQSLENLPEEILNKLSVNEKARYHRNYKCYFDVSKYNENQFILADVGLALCFDKDVWTPVTIDFDDKGYTTMIKTDISTVYTVFNTPTLKTELLDTLEKLYTE
jgi:hypothetical protein